MEVLVGREHQEFMSQAKPCQQRVDSAELQALSATGIAQLGRLDVIVPVRHDARQSREPVDDLAPRLRSGEALQQFLQHEASGYQRIATLERARQFQNFRHVDGRVAPQCQRPDARVDE
jgi:hypothetical protein